MYCGEAGKKGKERQGSLADTGCAHGRRKVHMQRPAAMGTGRRGPFREGAAGGGDQRAQCQCAASFASEARGVAAALVSAAARSRQRAVSRSM